MFCGMGPFCVAKVATRLAQHPNMMAEIWVRVLICGALRTAHARLRAQVELARLTPRLDFDTAVVGLFVHIAQLAAATLIHFKVT